MSSDNSDFFGTLDLLSSGREATDDVEGIDTIFSVLFDILGDAASWAGAVANLIGLIN